MPIQWERTESIVHIITHMMTSPDDKFVVYVNQPWNVNRFPPSISIP